MLTEFVVKLDDGQLVYKAVVVDSSAKEPVVIAGDGEHPLRLTLAEAKTLHEQLEEAIHILMEPTGQA